MVEQASLFGVLAKAALEQVERRVVAILLGILAVVLHFHLDRVAVVVLANFEVLVAKLLVQFLQHRERSQQNITTLTKSKHK